MGALISKPTQPQRSKDQIAARLKLHERSTGTTKDSCKEHNISEAAFYAARKKYGAGKSIQQLASSFSPLTQPVLNTVPTALFAVVGEIKIYQAVAPDYHFYQKRHCGFNRPTCLLSLYRGNRHEKIH